MREGFFKRGKVWWFRTDPLTGKAESSRKRDFKSAQLEYQRRARCATDPDYRGDEAEENLGQWVLKLIDQKEQHRSAATTRFYTQKLGQLVRFFGADAPLSDLRPKNWDRYVKQRRAEGVKNATIDKEIAVGKVLARFAKREGAFHGDPDLFKPPDFSTDAEARTRFLPPAELEALLSKLSPKRAAHVALSVAVGPRYSEAFKVERADIDLTKWTVMVHGTKTKKSRARVPIAEPFRPLLLASLPFLPLEPWANMTRDLERACIRAGIAKVTSNDLRRTHGSWLVEAGVQDSLVGRVLRHGDERMVRKVYGQARPEELGNAIAAQIAVTKTRQSKTDEVGGPRENPQNVQVAQSVEQRTEKPTFRLGDWAEAIGNARHNRDFGGELGSPGSAESRRVRNKNATVILPPVKARLRAELMIEATNLAFDQTEPGKLRPAAKRRIRQILAEVANG